MIINKSALKNIAIFTMFCDHFALMFLPGDSLIFYILRLAGRLAMPLFAYSVAEGLYYSSSKCRYLVRILLTAIIAVIPFHLFHNGKIIVYNPNILFTFSLAIASVILMDKVQGKWKKILIGAVTFILAAFARVEYEWLPIALVYVFYFIKEDRRRQLGAATAVLLGGMLILNAREACNLMAGGTASEMISELLFSMALEIPGILAMVVIWKYTGKKGQGLPKWFYYAFYPAHFLILWLTHAITV